MKKMGKWKNAYLLKLLDGTLVNTAALVDQVTCDMYEYVNKSGEAVFESCLPVVVDFPESTWPITTTLM